MTTATATKDRPDSSALPATPLSTPSAGVSTAKSARPVILVGFDFGTNKSCILAGPAGSNDLALSKVVPTVVGYAKEGIVSGIITHNASILFGEDALQHRLHANLVFPMAKGVIAHREPARDFLKHLRGLIDPSGRAEIRAVIGVPANASDAAREDVRQSVTGLFERVLLIPEPFLAALGYRDDARLGQPGYVDPVTNSLFIDIGGGTTDLCLVQGYFPTAEDQISLPFAGDAMDEILAEEISRQYPNTGLSGHRIRELKEAGAYVGAIRKPIDVEVIIGGKTRTLELGEALGRSGNSLLDRIVEAARVLIARASSDSVAVLLQNIVVTGGGSQIKGIDTVLQQRLLDEGYASPKVRLAGADYKRYVALGALKAARAARESQWQYLLA
ncbi:MAG TPA: rod shape-determining protein [Opitutaceae bacterium]